MVFVLHGSVYNLCARREHYAQWEVVDFFTPGTMEH